MRTGVIAIAALFAIGAPLMADGFRVGASVGANTGEYIWAGRGGPQNGFQLTYRQDYRVGGLFLGYDRGALSLQADVAATGKTVRSGGARDEDFVVLPWSELKSNSLFKGSPFQFRDTAYAFRQETYNFIDFTGGNPLERSDVNGVASRLNTTAVSFGARHYLGPGAEKQTGAFGSIAFRYSVLDLSMGDGDLYIIRSSGALRFFPFASNGTYSAITQAARVFEVPFGGGYSWQLGPWTTTLHGALSYAWARAEDTHTGSHITRFRPRGTGYLAGVQLTLPLAGDFEVGLNVVARRVYLVGDSERREPGTITWSTFQSYHNIKENRISIAVARVFGTGRPK